MNPRGGRASAFHGCTNTIVADGDYAVRDSRFTPGEHLAAHAHDTAYLCLVLDGVFAETIADLDEIAAGPGTVYYVPAGCDHSNTFGPSGAHCLRVEIANSTGALLREELATIARPVAVAGGPASWSALRLFRHAMAGRAGVGQLDECLVETLVHLDPGPSSTRPVPPRWLRSVRDRLQDTLNEHPALRTLAREAGVHPVHLARTFRRHYGCSIGECHQTMRLTRAAALLTHTSHSLVEIAGEVGYCDQSHFTRSFKARTGVTPTAFRNGGGRGGRC